MELTRKELYDLVWSEPMTTICKRFEQSEDENNLFRHIPMISLVILLIRCKAYAIYRLAFLPIVERIMRLAILIQRSAHARLSLSLIHIYDKPHEKFCRYDSVGDSYEHHSRFLTENSRYARCFALSPDDYKGWTCLLYTSRCV